MSSHDWPQLSAHSQSSLENAFFLAEDRRLLNKLRALEELKDQKQALADVSGISNDGVLEKLVALGITPQTVAALAVVPLVEVAWADGEVDHKERQAILEGLERSGLAADGIEHELVQVWLARHPGPQLLAAWQHYLRGLCEEMTEAERRDLRDEVLKGTRAVAAASGGVAGLGKISAAERDMIAQLADTFR